MRSPGRPDERFEVGERLDRPVLVGQVERLRGSGWGVLEGGGDPLATLDRRVDVRDPRLEIDALSHDPGGLDGESGVLEPLDPVGDGV